MADIVVLYASPDRDLVQRLIDWLDTQPWSFWWDRYHAAGPWPGEVERQIQNARCVLPVWSERSRGGEAQVPNEVNYAKQREKPRIHVRIEPVLLPVHVSLETYTDIDLDSRSGLDELGGRLQATLGGKLDVTRPPTLVVGSKEHRLPAFIRSVSSFQTLGHPRDALIALERHPSSAPILVSAFDLDVNAGTQESAALDSSLRNLDERGCIVFIDSGNYEAYRLGIGQHQKPDRRVERSAQWTPDRYEKVLSSEWPLDFALTFDNPLFAGERERASDEVVREFEAVRTFANRGPRPIPIIHVPRNGDGELRLDSLIPLVDTVCKRLDPEIIAIPERELGEGIIQRARTVHRVRRVLNSCSKYRLLHILGAGNPYSILAFAAAGADLFDGLEWCRTVADPQSARLHHVHHFDFFLEHLKYSEFDTVRDLSENTNYPYYMKLLVHNLDFFHRWMVEVRDRLNTGEGIQMLREYLSTSADVTALDALEQVLQEVQ